MFTVTVDGATVLNRLDLNAVGPDATQPATTGANADLTSTTAFVYAQTLQLTAGQTVLINFVQQTDNPLVCGILLVPANSSTSSRRLDLNRLRRCLHRRSFHRRTSRSQLELEFELDGRSQWCFEQSSDLLAAD